MEEKAVGGRGLLFKRFWYVSSKARKKKLPHISPIVHDLAAIKQLID